MRSCDAKNHVVSVGQRIGINSSSSGVDSSEDSLHLDLSYVFYVWSKLISENRDEAAYGSI